MPDGKTINRSSGLYNFAERRSEEIELVYGRGDVQIRRERPTFPNEMINAEDSELIVLATGKQLEFLQHTLKQLKGYKIESNEELRLVRTISEALQDIMIEYRVKNAATATPL